MPEAAGLTHVELTTYSEPATLIDRLKEAGGARWLRRQTRTALERLRMVFEEPPPGELKRATVAGYEPQKAPRFGAPTGADPARAAYGVNSGGAGAAAPRGPQRGESAH
jgi:hypothetical protein